MVLFDDYLLRYISEFLSKCNKCKKYDYNKNDYNKNDNRCSVCKTYFCSDCSKYKLNNGNNDFETLDLYCKNCVSEYYV